jgi:hypothetical protein
LRVAGGGVSSEVETLRARAAELAGRFSAVARRSATIAQERAILRMLGVDGLDRDGHPLAASLAERYCGADRTRLARGMILPFAVALLEYDIPARELALEGASGAIDLGLEAELLGRPDRLAAAEAHASKLLSAALARFDANRTAARENREVLGLAGEPWLGVALRAAEVGEAADETKTLVSQGADVVQVRVPASWEFAEARRHAGLTIPEMAESGHVRSGRDRRSADRRAADRRAVERRVADRRAFDRLASDRLGSLRQAIDRRRNGNPAPVLPNRSTEDFVPAGSQRGLAELRRAADEAAAERGCYAGLMTVTSAFAAPEQAVVAAFERIDMVEADPIREIVEDNVDPDRALADHAFAHRLQARAGCRVVLDAGPLALGADLASGIPSDAATRAGRGLALQALGAELALADGLPADRLVLGAVPEWIASEGDPEAILVQAWLRRIVYPGLRLSIEESRTEMRSHGRSASLVAALSGAAAGLVVRDRRDGSVADSAEDLRAAATAAGALRASIGDGQLRGDAADLAMLTLRAANLALERLAAEGWTSVLGPGGTDPGGERLGRAAVLERAAGPGSGERLLAGLI